MEKGKTGKGNGKVLLISYNQIEGFPAGRYENDRLIVLSAHTGGQLLADGRWVADGSVDMDDRFMVANAAVEGIEEMLSDTKSSRISEAIVYVGQRAIKGALQIAKDLSAQGTKVRIVGCDCRYSVKAGVAKELGVAYELSECGGVRTMGRIAREYHSLEALAR